MLKEFQVASFEGGSLRLQSSDESRREVVLGLPLNRLIVRMVLVPAEADPVEFSTPLLQAQSPYPDDALTVSCELVRETPEGRVMVAAALPESSADDIADALDAAKLSVVRIDALVMGEIRRLWNAINVQGESRKLLLVQSEDCISVVALDADQPSAIRAIVDLGELKREVMLSLLAAEDFGGARKLEEIVWVGDGLDQAVQELTAFAPVRKLDAGDGEATLAGLGERAQETGSLNALPESWHEVLEETRFKAKLLKRLMVAGGVWVLIMAVFLAVPLAFGFMTDHQKDLCKRHAKQFQSVKDKKAKVDMVRKYSDHSRGALEILRCVSNCLPPEGVELVSWEFRRDSGVTINAESDENSLAYTFKDNLSEVRIEEESEDEDGEPFFEIVNLGSLSGKTRKRFRIDCQYKAAEE